MNFFMNSRESMIPRGPWQNAVPPPDISTSDGDLLGLRCISQYIILHIHLHLLIIYNPIPWGPIYALFTPGRWCQVLGLVKLSPQNLQQLKGKPFKPSAWPRGRLLFYKAYIYYFILLLIFHYLACYHLLQVRVHLFYKALTEVPLHNYHPQHIYFLDSQLQGPTIYLEA